MAPRDDFRPTPLHRPDGSRAAREEIRHHLAELTDRLIEGGWEPDEARREAERRFGDPERYEREIVEARGTTTRRWGMRDAMNGFVQDVVFAFRAVRRRPGLGALIVLMLGTAIGAGTAIFSVADALVLRPLPYQAPERLMQVATERPGGFRITVMLAADAWTFLEEQAVFEDAAVAGTGSLVRTDGEPETTEVLYADPALDDLLGLGTTQGRLLDDGDLAAGGRVVLLTHRYWLRRGGDPEVVGSTVELEGVPFTVVGVLEPGHRYPVYGTTDLWVPLEAGSAGGGFDVPQTLRVVGRLPEGVVPEQGQERLEALTAGLTETHPSRIGWDLALDPVAEGRGEPRTRLVLAVLGAAVGLMLLVGLLNGANLMLAQGRRRMPEISVRRALGGSRLRVLRQFIAEALILALAAGGVAALLATGGVRAVAFLLPDTLRATSVYDFTVGPRALAVAFLLATASGLVLGLLPGLGLVRAVSEQGMRSAERAGATRRRRCGSDAMVVLQVAISIVLLAGAGLLVGSFARLAGTEPGIDAERLAYLQLQLSPTTFPTGAERLAFLDRLESRLEAIPGVTGVARGHGMPPRGGFTAVTGGGLETDDGELREAIGTLPFTSAGGDYLDVLGARLVAGRALRDADAGRPVRVVNGSLARALFGSAEAAVGRRYRMVGGAGGWTTVVGVVDPFPLAGIDEPESAHAVLQPRQRESAPSWNEFAVRTAGTPEALFPEIRRAVRELAPTQPIRSLVTAEDALGDSLKASRFLMTLMSTLAGLALAMGILGVYAVLAAMVADRRHELGVRAALGAGRATLRRMILARGALLAAVGVVLGALAAPLLSGFASALLVGVEPDDPAVLAAVAGLAFTAALAASWVPAVRATRVDPLETLRPE